MKAILLLTRVDADDNGVGHVTTIAQELDEDTTVGEVIARARHFVHWRDTLSGVKMEIFEVEKCDKAQEEK